MKPNFLNTLLLSGIIIVGGSVAAMAQFAPGSHQEAKSAAPVSNSNTQLDNPCPEPKRALSSTPDDMAKIQEDITRFTLCVQRAQLLERLNELAESNIGTIDTALNITASSNVMNGNATPGIMPSVPMPQLSESISTMLQQGGGVTENQNGAVGSGTRQAEKPKKQPSPWRVRDIQGSGGTVSARLINNDGMMFKVTQGDDLPENGGKVQSLSNTMIIIARDGDTEILKWVE